MKPPAFQFYADDFIGGTCDLSQAEVGAYMRLLCYQWGRGEIPFEAEKLERIAGGPVSVDVLAKFQKGKNQRMENERKKQAAYRAERAKSGAKGAEKRWHSEANGSAMAQPMAQGMAKNGSPSPSPSPSPTSKLRRPSRSTRAVIAARSEAIEYASGAKPKSARKPKP